MTGEPQQTGNDAAPLLSRPSEVSPFGKSDDEVAVSMPRDLRTALAHLASLEGRSLSGYCRDVLETHALLAERRLDRILSVYGVGKNREKPG